MYRLNHAFPKYNDFFFRLQSQNKVGWLTDLLFARITTLVKCTAQKYSIYVSRIFNEESVKGAMSSNTFFIRFSHKMGPKSF